MAEHADTGGLIGSTTKGVLVVCAVAVVALGSIGGWLGYRIVEDRRERAEQSRLVEAARQGAINLTTIDHATVDEDIKRILESSTGTFHDDFERRSQSFADVVRKAQSTSKGTVTSAALESRDGSVAQVLVVASVEMSAAGTAEPNPRVWRMRIGVEQSGDDARISDVQFVS
jgi:Mce-associated membrane protein